MSLGFGGVVFNVFHLACKAEEVGEGGGDQRTSGMVHVEDRSLRGACQNAVVMSTLLLADDNNYRLCQLIFAVGEPLKAWHGAQARELISCSASLSFLYSGIVEGAFLKHISSIISKLFSVSALEKCCFILTPQALVLIYFLVDTPKASEEVKQGQQASVYDVSK